jgi:tRNA-binding EMAP/Myf-like protein
MTLMRSSTTRRAERTAQKRALSRMKWLWTMGRQRMQTVRSSCTRNPCHSNAQQTLVAKESHKAQRALQEQRKAAKPHSQLIASAKRVWSLARQKNISPIERQKHVRDLLDIVTGKVKDIVLKHDASRIIQTIVRYGGQKERDQVAGELKGHYKELAQSKYSKVSITAQVSSCSNSESAPSFWLRNLSGFAQRTAFRSC